MSKPMSRSAFLRLVCVLALAAVCFAGWRPVSAKSVSKSVAETLPMNVTFQHKKPISIPLSGKTKIDFATPAAKKSGVLCVKFRAYLKMDVTGGWANYLQLSLNGKTLGEKTKGGTDRLLNRGNGYTTVKKEHAPWWDSKNRLVTFFGPENKLDSRIATPREEGYWYLLDISDLAKAGAQNHLVIANEYPGGSACREMVIKDLSIGYVTLKKKSGK
jgi:hypothetical protein